jgi:small subunit ribosomal protein S4e
MYMKRKAMPKSWPLPRKGTTYVIKSSERTMPLLVIIRDILGIVKTRKEGKTLLNDSEIVVDGKTRKEISYPAGLFSVVSLPKIKKYYKIDLVKNKFAVKEIKEDDANSRPFKIIGKTILKGNKQQINLNDGRNLISKEKMKINDSVLINLKDNKILKYLPIEKGANVYIIGGKNIGMQGKITEAGEKIIVKSDEKMLSILPKNIFVVEK